MSTEITISIDKDKLRSYTDSFLAVAWHVAQANPAPIDDPDAGELAEVVGWEIIRRWLSAVEPELWHHQGRHYFSIELRKFARYVPPAACSALSDEFHRGHWVARETTDEPAARPDANEPGKCTNPLASPTETARGETVPDPLTIQAD